MNANASFEEEEVVNFAHAYESKAIFLLEMVVAHNRTAFHCRCCCEVLPPHPHKPHPRTRRRISVRALAHFLSCQRNGKHSVPSDWCLWRLHKYNNSPLWTMVKSKEYKIIRCCSKLVAPLAWNIWYSYLSLHATFRQGWVIKPGIKWLWAAKLSTTDVVSHYQSRHLSFVRSLFFGICIITLRNA